jgi:hypothetical protein
MILKDLAGARAQVTPQKIIEFLSDLFFITLWLHCPQLPVRFSPPLPQSLSALFQAKNSRLFIIGKIKDYLNRKHPIFSLQSLKRLLYRTRKIDNNQGGMRWKNIAH